MPQTKASIRLQGLRAAVLVHFALVFLVTGVWALTANKCSNCLLIYFMWMQELVALVSAVYVWTKARGTCPWPADGPYTAYDFHYSLKWTEYAVSATLGAFVIYVSGDPTDEAWPAALLVFLSAGQQQLGYLLDVETTLRWQAKAQFVFAWAVQIAEFAIVFTTAKPKVTVYVVYVLLWSSFGVVCGLRLLHLARAPSSSAVARWLADRWASELAYTALGWSAKGAVVITAFPYIFADTVAADAFSAVLAAGCVAVSAAVLRRTQRLAVALYGPSNAADEDSGDDDDIYSGAVDGSAVRLADFA